MGLENFFALSEMQGGLTTPLQVKELLNAIVEQEDAVGIKDFVELSKLWTKVARTIMSTENKECLNHFVQLSGLNFINRWLDTVQKQSDTPNSLVEESKIALSQAQKKLQIDSEVVNVSKDAMVDEEQLPICQDIRPKAMQDKESKLLEISQDKVSTTKNDISNSATADSPLLGEVLQSVEVASEVGVAVVSNHEDMMTATATESIPVKGPMVEDADSKHFSIGARCPSDSIQETEHVVLTNKEEKTDITSPSAEQMTDGKYPLIPTVLETGTGSIGSDAAEVEKAAAEAVPQVPLVIASGAGTQAPVDSSSLEETLDASSNPFSKPVPEGPLSEIIPSGNRVMSREAEVSQSDDISVEAGDGLTDNVSSNESVVAQEAQANPKKGLLDFDLNDEFCSEDVDPLLEPNPELDSDKVHQQPSVFVSVVSTSKVSSVPVLPTCPIPFEGAPECKGSATTRVFRLASPLGPPDSGNVTSSTDPSTCSQKQQYVLDIDLNKAESEDADSMLDTVITVSSSHPSEGSCVELGPGKSKRMELDLNSMDHAPPTFASKNGLLFNQFNPLKSPSPTSSSSSVHPSMLEIDLNRNLSATDASYDPNPHPYFVNPSFQTGNPYRAAKPTDSASSIFGTQVDPGRKELFPQSPYQPNITGMGGFFGLGPTSIHSGLAPSSVMYHPGFPVTMVDPRGSPYLPHIVGSSAPHPYFMNLMGARPVVGPPHPSLDLNMLRMNPRQDEPNSRQFIMTNQGSFLEPHSSTIPQPSFLIKRKEPHTGFDPYKYGPKRHDSPGKS